MKDKQSTLFRYLLTSLILLLTIRLAFFLQDGTSDFIESVLIWIIFLYSGFILGLYIFLNILSFKKFYFNYQDKIYIGLMIITIEFFFKINNSLKFTPVYLFSTLLMVTIILLFSSILPKRISKIFDISFVVFYSSYMLFQDVYFRIFDDFFSFQEIVNLQEGVESSQSMYEFSILHLLIIILATLTIVFYIKLKKVTHIKINKANFKLIVKFPLLLFLLTNINVQFPVNFARLNLSDHYLYSSLFDKTEFVSRFSTVNLLVRDLEVTLTPSFSTKRDTEYVDNYFLNNEKVHDDNDYTGIFEGKNLIFIIGESFDSIAISEELTPNIYKLKNEGINFANHFTPVFPRTTCDSEVVFNTSLIPSITEGPTCYEYNDNYYSESLANLFNAKGYKTTGFHSNYKEFYTRYLVYEGFGYDSFYGQHELNLSETEQRFDSIFAEKSLDLMIPDTTPFFTSIMTLSGHSPYNDINLAVQKNYDTVDDYYGDSVPTSIKGFIATQIELDLMVGVILEGLEDKGQLDNTIIILTNDHYPYTLDQGDYETYKNIGEEYEKQRGELYIWSNGKDHEEITKLSSSFDILPTILNMFNLDGDYINYVGNDVFNDQYDPLVYFKDYSIYDGDNHYKFTSTSDIVNNDYIAIAKKYYEVSKRILKVDYFNK